MLGAPELGFERGRCDVSGMTHSKEGMDNIAPGAWRRRTLALWPHLVALGLWHLARARTRLSKTEPRTIAARNAHFAAVGQLSPRNAPHAKKASRRLFVLHHLAQMVPWRSDCLVHALAAQSWLGALGLASEIRIGADKGSDNAFEAHAWLILGGDVATGGDVERFAALFPSPTDGRTS